MIACEPVYVPGVDRGKKPAIPEKDRCSLAIRDPPYISNAVGTLREKAKERRSGATRLSKGALRESTKYGVPLA